jgi:hypothetical protein
MPHVATIDGVKILFFNDEHPPPHFHAQYAEFIAMIDLETFEILEGNVPKPQYRKVIEWAKNRQPQLRAAWLTCQNNSPPGKIP